MAGCGSSGRHLHPHRSRSHRAHRHPHLLEVSTAVATATFIDSTIRGQKDPAMETGNTEHKVLGHNSQNIAAAPCWLAAW